MFKIIEVVSGHGKYENKNLLQFIKNQYKIKVRNDRNRRYVNVLSLNGRMEEEYVSGGTI